MRTLGSEGAQKFDKGTTVKHPVTVLVSYFRKSYSGPYFGKLLGSCSLERKKLIKLL